MNIEDKKEAFEIVKDYVDGIRIHPEVEKWLSEDENKFYKLCQKCVGRKEITEEEYDNLTEAEIKEFVLNDFSSKVLSLFIERPFTMPSSYGSLELYNMFNRYKDSGVASAVDKYIELMHLNDIDETTKYVADYISDYMSHNYIGRGVNIPTPNDVRRWGGGGEFPYLKVYVIFRKNGNIIITYRLSR